MDYYKNLGLESIKYIDSEGFNKIELWIPIKEYEEFYEISDLGRVKSLERKTFRKLTGLCFHMPRILKPTDDGRGYLAVQLNKNGKGHTARIHQLVAVAFLNHTPNGYTLVPNHIDLNKYNNAKYNLEIITVRENSNLLHIPSKSSFVGVDWETRRKNRNWRARIHFNGKKKHLGYFDCELKAAEAYQIALKNINGHGRIKLT